MLRLYFCSQTIISVVYCFLIGAHGNYGLGVDPIGPVRHGSAFVWGRLGMLFGTVRGGSGLLLFRVFQYACSVVLLFNSVRFGFLKIWILGDCDFVILG